MQDLRWYFNRLRSMDTSEIAWRIRSIFRDQVDQIRFPFGWYPRLSNDSAAAFDEFNPGFSCSPVTSEAWAQLDGDTKERWSSRLIGQADRILENRLAFFDHDDIDIGDPPNWHRDHRAQRNAEVTHIARTDYRQFKKNGDCKQVWEPNRHHQLVVLGRAYRVSGNRIYAEKVAELMGNWIDTNPFGYGMNWKSSLEVGVRLINWVWAIDLVRDANVFGDKLWRDVRQTCFVAMWDVHRKLSRGSSANNHLIGEAAGVFVAACYFHDMPGAARWQDDCKAVIEREILLQTYPDGCSREHAFGYQFFVMQFYIASWLAGRSTGNPLSASTMSRLHAIFCFMKNISSDTGAVPNMGDKDDGYVLDLGERPDSPEHLLAVGAALFNDPSLLHEQPAEWTFWLMGTSPAKDHPGTRANVSTSFEESGYHILRASRKSEPAIPEISIFFDTAELGFGPIAAHGHADALSILVAVGGLPFIVDAGTYDYFSFPAWRQYYRSTKAHNTVEIDGRSQSETRGPFIWGHKASATLKEWYDDEHVTRAVGEQDGYARLERPVTHKRTVQLSKTDGSFTVTDMLDTSGSHTAAWHFHFDPGCQVVDTDLNRVVVRRGDCELVIASDDLKLSVIRADDSDFLGWISDSYHEREPSFVVFAERSLSGRTEACIRFESRFVTFRQGD